MSQMVAGESDAVTALSGGECGFPADQGEIQPGRAEAHLHLGSRYVCSSNKTLLIF